MADDSRGRRTTGTGLGLSGREREPDARHLRGGHPAGHQRLAGRGLAGTLLEVGGGAWYPSQRLTLAETIRGFTLDAAYAAFEENTRGTIEPGKLADFTIIEGDLYAMPPSELHKARVKATVSGGKIVYQAK